MKRWLMRHTEYHLHVLPTSSPWLNQVERLFAAIAGKCTRRGVFRRVPAQGRAIMADLAEHDTDPKPCTWVADTDSILDRIKKVRERTSDSRH